MTVLPLRVIDQPGGLVIRCLCGAESAVVRPSSELSVAVVRASHGVGTLNRGVSPDVSPAAVVRMAAHAKTCVPGRNRALEGAL
ncbi:MAG TPA: hypothetical protein VGS19_23815 [Streptosporangiaceae bacterium]|nr:hypothetical protein [Streptosporangiaceae bacterium]